MYVTSHWKYAKKTARLPERLKFWEETSKKDSKGLSEDLPFAAVQYILGIGVRRKRKYARIPDETVKTPIFKAFSSARQV